MASLPVKQVAKVPKKVRQSQAIEKADLWAARNLPKLLKKLKELAEGVLVEATDKHGDVVI